MNLREVVKKRRGVLGISQLDLAEYLVYKITCATSRRSVFRRGTTRGACRTTLQELVIDVRLLL